VATGSKSRKSARRHQRKDGQDAEDEDEKERLKRGQAFKRHILTKKTTKSKRHLRGPVQIADADVKSVRRMMPYA
jgi:ribosomal protein L35